MNLWGENTQATITNSTLSNFDNTEVEDYATIVLNNNGTDTAKGSVITITGGKIIAKDQADVPCTAVSNHALGTVTIDESTEVIGELRNNVAIVDYGTDSYYGCLSLQEAVDTASETADCTVILLTPIELTETVTVPAEADFTLDLNGQTISQTKVQTAAYSMIQNKGKLTIKDSSESKSGVITYTDSGNGGEYVSNTISNSGTLTIESGTIENMSAEIVGDNGYPYVIDNTTASATASLNVTGGTLYSEGYCAVRAFSNSTTYPTNINITSGEVIGGIEFQKPGANKRLANLSISGGKISNNATQNVLFIFGQGGDGSGMVINITGGEFTGKITMSSSMSIGDNFNKQFISGGSFKADPSEYVAEGYAATQNGEVWTVAAAN